jgi:hypothetical protein
MGGANDSFMTSYDEPDERQAVYAAGLQALADAKVPFLVGGGWALFAYLERWRTTKDIDLFLRVSDLPAALQALQRAGFQVEVTDKAWLAKARRDGALIDIIFCSYNGLFPVDDSWLVNGRDTVVLGVDCMVVGPEEMIVSKFFVAARDRFDGADVSWLLRALGPQLDWPRIEYMMRDHWMVLLWQLVHFLYVFPGERSVLPRDLVARLLAKLRRELTTDGDPRTCRGPMLDPKLYRKELEHGLEDPRPRRSLVEGELVELCGNVLIGEG